MLKNNILSKLISDINSTWKIWTEIMQLKKNWKGWWDKWNFQCAHITSECDTWPRFRVGLTTILWKIAQAPWHFSFWGCLRWQTIPEGEVLPGGMALWSSSVILFWNFPGKNAGEGWKIGEIRIRKKPKSFKNVTESDLRKTASKKEKMDWLARKYFKKWVLQI